MKEHGLAIWFFIGALLLVYGVLILGAGEMAQLAARELRSGGARELLVANRSAQRAKELARYQASVSGRDKLIPEVRLAAYRLVAPDRVRGWLIVESGTDVRLVDGLARRTDVVILARSLALVAPMETFELLSNRRIDDGELSETDEKSARSRKTPQ